MARSRIPQTPKPKMAIPTQRKKAAFVRMVNRKPGALTLYYDKETAQWTAAGTFTVWDIDVWTGLFGGQALTYSPDGKSCTDNDGRCWEFFGYVIPLYDDAEKI